MRTVYLCDVKDGIKEERAAIARFVSLKRQGYALAGPVLADEK